MCYTNQEKPIEELILNAKCKSSADYEKKMKIVDAVNDLRGGNVYLGSGSDSKNGVLVSNIDGDIFCLKRFKEIEGVDLVCSIKEYDNCIEEMKYHYDIPRWCSYNRADKELLTVENSDQSFYEKETFVYGQDVYVETLIKSDIKYKFGCLSLNGESAILLTERGNMVCLIARVSSKPIKPKEDIELEEAKKKQLHDNSFIYSHYFKSIDSAREMFLDMQEDGRLAEIILPLEKS